MRGFVGPCPLFMDILELWFVRCRTFCRMATEALRAGSGAARRRYRGAADASVAGCRTCCRTAIEALRAGSEAVRRRYRVVERTFVPPKPYRGFQGKLWVRIPVCADEHRGPGRACLNNVYRNRPYFKIEVNVWVFPAQISLRPSVDTPRPWPTRRKGASSA